MASSHGTVFRFLPLNHVQESLTPQRLVDAYFENKKQVQDRFPLMLSSAIKIQQRWRCYKQHKKYTDFKRKVILIQAAYRAYRSRKRVNEIVTRQAEDTSIYYYNYCAIQIQKIWRGYNVRRFDEQNYYVRKRELEMIRENQQKLQAYMEKEIQKLEMQRSQSEQEKQLKQFQEMAGSLHHLLSTKSINGVYNPPHLPLQTEYVQVTASIPSVGDDIPLESALRTLGRDTVRDTILKKSRKLKAATGKNSLNAQTLIEKAETNRMIPLDWSQRQNLTIDRTQKVAKEEIARAASVLIPIDSRDAKRLDQSKRLGPFLPQHKLLKNKLTSYEPSILRSSTYGHKQELEKTERKLNQLTRIGDNDFITACKPNEKLIFRSGPSLRSVDGLNTRTPIEKEKKLTPWKPKVRTDATFDKYSIPTIGIQGPRLE